MLVGQAVQGRDQNHHGTLEVEAEPGPKQEPEPKPEPEPKQDPGRSGLSETPMVNPNAAATVEPEEATDVNVLEKRDLGAPPE